MAATRTARVALTFLMALTVVVSVVAVPAAAVGHDPTHVGDDDPIGIETGNDSVSVSAGDDSVSVGTDGVETDTDDTADELESGSTDDGGDGISTVQDQKDEELPANYSDIPVGMLPVNLCQDAPQPPEPPVDPPTLPVPVDPTNPPSAPVSQCDVFNPYDPPFDPTDLPDDPEADYRIYQQEVSSEGVSLVVGSSASPDSDYPNGFTIVGVVVSEDGAQVVQYGRGDDGSRDFVVFSDVQHAPGTRTGSADVSTVTIGKRAGANIVCDGEVCSFDQGVAPVGEQEIPTDGSGGGSGAPAAVPCEYPVGPGDVPEPPVDPTNPPEPLPPVENPLPVNPTNPPSPPAKPCDVYDPNDPPSPNPDPDATYNVYEVSDDTVVVGGYGTYNRSGGPGGMFIAGGTDQGNETTIVQYARGNDGQKSFTTFVEANVDRDSFTKVGPNGYELESGTAIVVRSFGKKADASIVCDGSSCTIDQGIAPVGGQEIPTTAGGSSSSSTTTQSASSSSTTTATGPSDVASTPADAVASTSATVPSTDSFTVVPTFPGAFATGLPDAASAAETLMDLV